jgi:hypothetical protein
LEIDRSQSSEPWPTSSETSLRGAVTVDEPREDWRVIWAFAAVLVAFKLVGLAIVVYFMLQAGAFDGALTFLVATHAPFILVGLGLLYWPLSVLYRRARLRARRRQLIWAEWHVETTRTSSKGL